MLKITDKFDLVDVCEHAEEVPLLALPGQDPGQGLHVPAALHRVPPRVEPGHSRVRDDEVSVAGNLWSKGILIGFVYLYNSNTILMTFRILEFL